MGASAAGALPRPRRASSLEENSDTTDKQAHPRHSARRSVGMYGSRAKERLSYYCSLR